MREWLPGVKRQDFKRDGGSWTRQPATICLHSTEGSGWPGYQNGGNTPHFTIAPKTGEIRQHVPLTRAGRALVHPKGTPETNRHGTIQIEIIGSCDRAWTNRHGLHFLPDMTTAQMERVAGLVGAIARETGVPLVEAAVFRPYPKPGYGSGAPRLAWDQWKSARGVLGHQHVPGNDHGDPGDIPIRQILQLAAPPKAPTPAPDKAPPPAKDDGMAKDTAKAVWNARVVDSAGKDRTAGFAQGATFRNSETIHVKVDALALAVEALTEKVDGMIRRE